MSVWKLDGDFYLLKVSTVFCKVSQNTITCYQEKIYPFPCCFEQEKYCENYHKISLTPFIFVQATCNALGAYLAEIQSRDEQEFIEDIKTKSNISYYCYFAVVLQPEATASDGGTY